MTESFITLDTFKYFLISFALLFAIHVFFWRVLKVKMMIFWMFFIFAFLPLAGAAGLYFYGVAPEQIVPALILLLAFDSAYIMSYPAAQAQSPTMVILLTIYRNRKSGITKGEIIQQLSSSKLIQDRLNDLENDGLVKQVEGKMKVAPIGMLLGSFFYNYRRVIGLKKSKG